MIQQVFLFLYTMPKSYKIAKRCIGNGCLNVFETHIWRFYKIEVEPKIKNHKEL